MERLSKKAKLLSQYIKGKEVVDLGSESGTKINVTALHRELENFSGKKIISVDILGNPDIKSDLNKKFPFKDNRFDTIIASEIIEHLDCPLEFLKECKRVLKKGGRLLLTTPNAVGLSEICGLIRDRKEVEYGSHLYNWNRKNMDFLIDKAKLKTENFKYISFYWRRNMAFRFIAWLMPFLRTSLFYVLTKNDKK